MVHVTVSGTGSQIQYTQNTHISNGVNTKLFSAGYLTAKASPNPVKNILNLYSTGFEQNKQLTISVVSISGVTIKTIQKTSGQIIQMDVSLLRPGVYLLKVISGDKIANTQFVKL